MDRTPIPSRADWGELEENDLDGQAALRSFFGKSLEEAEALFQRNALFYQEELSAMPAGPFNFYAPALVRYVLSDRASGDADGASSFLEMVRWMLEKHHRSIRPEVEEALVSAAADVAGRQEFYEADVAIYGRFEEKLAEIRALAQGR